jgi:hypothetical protein
MTKRGLIQESSFCCSTTLLLTLMKETILWISKKESPWQRTQIRQRRNVRGPTSHPDGKTRELSETKKAIK